jgi:hypothetical protein
MDFIVAVLAAFLIYVLVVSAIIRTFQAIHRKDELMREMTAAWIENPSRAPSH